MYTSIDHWNETVELRRTFRDGTITRESLPRWTAEIFLGAIPLFEPNVERAMIEVRQTIISDPKAFYPVKQKLNWAIARRMTQFVPASISAQSVNWLEVPVV